MQVSALRSYSIPCISCAWLIKGLRFVRCTSVCVYPLFAFWLFLFVCLFSCLIASFFVCLFCFVLFCFVFCFVLFVRLFVSVDCVDCVCVCGCPCHVDHCDHARCFCFSWLSKCNQYRQLHQRYQPLVDISTVDMIRDPGSRWCFC